MPPLLWTDIVASLLQKMHPLIQKSLWIVVSCESYLGPSRALTHVNTSRTTTMSGIHGQSSQKSLIRQSSMSMFDVLPRKRNWRHGCLTIEEGLTLLPELRAHNRTPKIIHLWHIISWRTMSHDHRNSDTVILQHPPHHGVAGTDGKQGLECRWLRMRRKLRP